MKLVVGLGNPGREYVGTRHNVGFEVIDKLAEKFGFSAKKNFDAIAFDGLIGAEKVVLLKPQTFMNVSGKSVLSAMSFYQLAPADMMIVLDDLALPCGKLRIRPGGSSGGHNGLRDIERVLATSEYPRLRLGIDPPPPMIPGKDYVLGRFTDEQRKKVDPAIYRAAEAILTWMEEGIEAAMNRFNSSPSPGTPGEGRGEGDLE